MYRPEITKIMIRVVDKLTQLVYRASGGRLGVKQLSYSILLLHTIGRKKRSIAFPFTARARKKGFYPIMLFEDRTGEPSCDIFQSGHRQQPGPEAG